MRKLSLLSFLLVFGLGCVDSPDQELAVEFSDEDFGVFNQEFDRIQEDIKDTRELTFLLKENGYSYNSTLLNNVENSKEYLNAKEQCLNIGVFAADLNYMTVYDKDNLAQSYVDAIYDMGIQLSIDEAFNKNYLNEIIKNDIPNYRLKSDELDDIFEQAKEEIKNAERAQISALIIAGGWIEGMYHSTSMASENWPHEEIAYEMWSQCQSYHSVKNLLHIFKDYPPCDEVYGKFSELEPAIANITNGDVDSLKKNIDSLHGIMLDLREYIISI